MAHSALTPCTRTPDCYTCLAIHAQNQLLWKLRMPTAAQAALVRERVAVPLVARIVAQASGAKLVAGDGSLLAANQPQGLYAQVMARLNATPVANFEPLAAHIELLLKALWYRGQLPSDAFYQLRMEAIALRGADAVRDEVCAFLRRCEQHPEGLAHHLRHARVRLPGPRYALEVVEGLRGDVWRHMGAGVRTRGERWVFAWFALGLVVIFQRRRSTWRRRADALTSLHAHLAAHAPEPRCLAVCMALHKRLGGGAAMRALGEDLVKLIAERPLLLGARVVGAWVFAEA